MKPIIIAIACILFSVNATAQTRYIVKFKDKGTNPFSMANPSQYLSQRSLQRRTRYNIAIDSVDLPVTPRYIDSVRLAGAVTILNASKWLNQVTIRTTDVAALAKINSFPFVVSSTATASRTTEQPIPVNKVLGQASATPFSFDDSSSFAQRTQANDFAYGASNGQVRLHKGEFLHNHGFKGEEMLLAVLDAGFFRYQTLPTFDSIRINNQILNVWDFVANEQSVNEDDSHGMTCLSTIAANIPGVFVGTAPKANFCLYRTEDVATETRIEEHNLAAGYERADSIGADICSVSLGYTTFDYASQNYTYADMNGNTTMAAIATDIAAKKGMLPVIAAGNDGSNAWHYISTPADADSAMAVGAVDTLGNVAGFSSFGPSSDGQIKPSVAATGAKAVVASPNTGMPVYSNGTSFAAPNIAGLTTCLWQAFPEYNNIAILDAMQKSANNFATPNDRTGYGVPDVKKAFVILLRKSYTQQSAITGCTASVQLNVKYDNSIQVTVQRKQSNEVAYSNFKTFAGTGNFINKNVSFTDDLAATSGGNVSYRVRLDIAADTSVYLDSLVVNTPQTCSKPMNSIMVNPNPVIDNANIIISRTQATKISITLTNALGQQVYTTTYQQPAGSMVKTINMQQMQAGVYFINVFTDEKKLETIKILKR
ncbi:MAG: S8 family peptidase [Ferruginibacter sp.]